jgi:hypothetical protein
MDSYSPAAASGDGDVLGFLEGGATLNWFNQAIGSDDFIKESGTKVTYTKVGRNVMVNGYYELSLDTSWRSRMSIAGASDPSDVLVIGLGEDVGTTNSPSQFPFFNDSDSPIYVDVEMWDVNISAIVATGSQTTTVLKPYSNVDVFGLIKPGKRYIELYYVNKETLTSATGNVDYVKNPLVPYQLGPVTTTPMKITFSFNMPTIVNTGRTSYSTGGGVQSGGGGSQFGS